LAEAVDFFCTLTGAAGCPFRGGLDQKRHLPTILGSFQSVSLAPHSLWNSDSAGSHRASVVGIEGLSSFDACFAAERLNYHAPRLGLGTSYVAREIRLSQQHETVPSTLQFAHRFDQDAAFRQELQEALTPIATEDTDLIILPGILGLHSKYRDISDFEQAVGCPLSELPTLPPSVPGLRLFHALEAHLRKIGVEFYSGFSVKELEMEQGHCRGVMVDIPGRPLALVADSVVLASGQFSGHLLGPLYSGVDADLHPVTALGQSIADNLYVTGALLREGGGRGGNERAIVTGYRAGLLAARPGRHHGAS
jgi:glycerol-3-phosphate dehydrogenase subunit B